jgi:hypothetical protein
MFWPRSDGPLMRCGYTSRNSELLRMVDFEAKSKVQMDDTGVAKRF